MNRIDRLTAIIIYLQGRSRVTVDDLADRYNISPRTVYRDLTALQEAGVPLGSEQGKGYFIVRGYHLPPVMFNRNEVAALLAGERLMQKWSETELGESYASALDKIRSVLRYKDKEHLSTLDDHIKVFPYQDERNITTDFKAFSFLQNAIVKKKVISIDYHSPYKDQTTQRKVEPLGLLLQSSHWYLAAWCRLRVDYRVFRVDRIECFSSTGHKFSSKEGHSLKEFSQQNLQKEQDLEEVIVQFKPDVSRYLGDQKYRMGYISEEETDNGINITFLTSSIGYFARWLLMWGNGVEIQRPDKLKQKVAQLSKELYVHHK